MYFLGNIGFILLTIFFLQFIRILLIAGHKNLRKTLQSNTFASTILPSMLMHSAFTN
jgi:hypothetical protein